MHKLVCLCIRIGRVVLLKAAVIGAAGYSGLELVKLLVSHPDVELVSVFGNSSVGQNIEEVHPSLKNIFSAQIKAFSPNEIKGVDVVFIALPSGESMKIAGECIKENCKVIDLGGDFRLKNAEEYNQYYKHEHTAKELLSESVYGLAEWNYKSIKHAKLIANPGCYPTSVLLPLIPLLINELIDESKIYITSYSGTSGAGKSLNANMLFSEVNESVRAYKVGSHQHIPEINNYLGKFSNSSVSVSFVPHLLPITRGIYTTIHTSVKSGITSQRIEESLSTSYKNKTYVRVTTPQIPELKNVINTNFCDISFHLSDDGTLVLFSAIDNLLKGAAGQAIQNMNIMFGLKETKGITSWN